MIIEFKRNKKVIVTRRMSFYGKRKLHFLACKIEVREDYSVLLHTDSGHLHQVQNNVIKVEVE